MGAGDQERRGALTGVGRPACSRAASWARCSSRSARSCSSCACKAATSLFEVGEHGASPQFGQTKQRVKSGPSAQRAQPQRKPCCERSCWRRVAVGWYATTYEIESDSPAVTARHVRSETTLPPASGPTVTMQLGEQLCSIIEESRPITPRVGRSAAWTLTDATPSQCRASRPSCSGHAAANLSAEHAPGSFLFVVHSMPIDLAAWSQKRVQKLNAAFCHNIM